MKETLELTKTFNAAPSEIYRAFLDSQLHSEMTGGEARCSNKVGGDFTAWDEYISGTNKSLTENKEIIQSWRTAEFDENDEDSELTIQLNETETGCELTLIQINIPEGETQYEQGWLDHYFAPMEEYFNNK